MTPDTFRQIALSMPEAVERSHMAHPDFRIGGKIFATLFGTGVDYGMVKLTPEQQQRVIKAKPLIYSPVKGGWGVRGATQVLLKKADKASLTKAMMDAWRNTAPKGLLDQTGAPGKRGAAKNPKEIPAAKASSTRASSASAHVALLRGINVGGKNKLPMPDLAAMFVEAGCTGVRTYIASGNVVFLSSTAAAKRVPWFVSDRIAKKFGLRVPVVLRTAQELRRAGKEHPFLKSDADHARLFIGFLADHPEPGRVKALDPNRSPGDSFQVRGREIYMSVPNGAADTKLTCAYFDSMLATTSTFRNWRTVSKLVEMATAMDE